MKYGFLGAGNMGSAIIRGMIKGGFDPKEIFVYDLLQDKLDLLAEECNIKKLKNEEEVFECDVVIIAIKPIILDENNVIRYIELVSEITSEPNYDAALATLK